MNPAIKYKIDKGLLTYNFNKGLNLQSISDDDCDRFEKVAKIIKLNKKAILYQEGEPAKGIYILKKGKIKMSQLNSDGSIQILFILGEGEIFGHRALIAGDNLPATTTALENCEVMFIEKEYFFEILNGSTQFNNMLMKAISYEFSVLVNRINIFAQKGIKERLALFLLILNEIYKVPGQKNDDAEITLNRNDLAGYTGTSVENLVRTLKVFKDNNYIRTNGKSIYINDFETLFALTGLS